jgi:hypothetical protein
MNQCHPLIAFDLPASPSFGNGAFRAKARLFCRGTL